MTQEAVLKALQNGPLTSHEVSNLTGMPQATVLSTAKKLRDKKELTISTKAEYAQMKAQATRLLGKPAKKEITNNQFI